MITLAPLLPFPRTALAADDTAAGATVTAFVNDARISGAVITEEGRVLVPMRAFFEATGARVYWDEASRTVRAFTGERTVTLQVDKAEAFISGQPVGLDVPPRIFNDRTYVPLRFASEALGGEVAWNDENRVASVRLNRPVNETVVALPVNANPAPDDETVLSLYSPEEIDLFVRVVNAESYGEPFEGKVAVAAVILNRVRSTRFPDSITDVLMAPNQFGVIRNGQANRKLHPDSHSAVIRALNGEDPSGGALYFTNLTKTPNRGFWSRLEVTARIGNHTFFR